MPQLTRRRTILAKIETTYGTDPTPTGAANAILVRNLDVKPQETELVSRDLIRPFLGNYEQLQANTHIEMSFEVEMAGAGAAGTAPAYGPLLRACGMSETIVASTTVTYAPISTSFESVTIYFNVDGVLHKITGARGSVELDISARQIPVYKFNFTGLYNAPIAGAVPTVTYTSFQQPLVVNQTNTASASFFSHSGVFESINLNVGNEVTFRSLVGTGGEYVYLTDRKAAGTVKLEAPLLATKDFFAAAKAYNSLGTLDVTHGTTAGNKVQVVSTRCNLSKVDYEDSNGIQMLSLPFQSIPSTSGNDDFSIVVK